jgi:hypothetical protein
VVRSIRLLAVNVVAVNVVAIAIAIAIYVAVSVAVSVAVAVGDIYGVLVLAEWHCAQRRWKDEGKRR